MYLFFKYYLNLLKNIANKVEIEKIFKKIII